MRQDHIKSDLIDKLNLRYKYVDLTHLKNPMMIYLLLCNGNLVSTDPKTHLIKDPVETNDQKCDLKIFFDKIRCIILTKLYADGKTVSFDKLNNVYTKIFDFTEDKSMFIADIINIGYEIITNDKYLQLKSFLLKLNQNSLQKHYLSLHTLIIANHIQRILDLCVNKVYCEELFKIYEKEVSIIEKIIRLSYKYIFRKEELPIHMKAVFSNFWRNLRMTEITLKTTFYNKMNYKKSIESKSAEIWLLEIYYLSAIYDVKIDRSSSLFGDSSYVLFEALDTNRYIVLHINGSDLQSSKYSIGRLESPSDEQLKDLSDLFVLDKYNMNYNSQSMISESNMRNLFNNIRALKKDIACVYYDLVLYYAIIMKKSLTLEILKESPNSYRMNIFRIKTIGSLETVLDIYKRKYDKTEFIKYLIATDNNLIYRFRFFSPKSNKVYSLKPLVGSREIIHTRVLGFTCGHLAGSDLLEEYFYKRVKYCCFCSNKLIVNMYYEGNVYLCDE